MSTTPRGNTFWRAPEQARRPGRARPWLGLGLAVVVVGYLLIFGDTGWIAVRKEARAVATLRSELDRTTALEASTRASNSELLRPASEELERIAREEYRMRGEGEEVHHLVGTHETDAMAPDAGESARRP